MSKVLITPIDISMVYNDFVNPPRFNSSIIKFLKVDNLKNTMIKASVVGRVHNIHGEIIAAVFKTDNTTMLNFISEKDMVLENCGGFMQDIDCSELVLDNLDTTKASYINYTFYNSSVMSPFIIENKRFKAEHISKTFIHSTFRSLTIRDLIIDCRDISDLFYKLHIGELILDSIKFSKLEKMYDSLCESTIDRLVIKNMDISMCNDIVGIFYGIDFKEITISNVIFPEGIIPDNNLSKYIRESSHNYVDEQTNKIKITNTYKKDKSGNLIELI